MTFSGETIPFSNLRLRMVASQLRARGVSDKVLEVGTGSGYLTALLGVLAAQIFSVERHPELAEAARELLGRMGYTNVRVIVGDGSQGLAEGSRYDAIIVSAAAPAVPPALLEQLAEGGRMI